MNPIQAKLNQIYEDFEANVTKVYQRRDLLMVTDLVAHSVLEFPFQGDLLQKGYTEALVIGDTRCGKTESVKKILKHYHCGEIVTGENTSYAGLVGGLQQTQKTWSITWGKYPLNDRRMVVLDEASGLQHETIGHMSGMRSSGVAEITKIQTERTPARVRSLWLANPRGKRPMAAFNTGIHAIEDLIGQPEDISRFDLALTIATGEVPLAIINASKRVKVPHRYTSELSNRLVYWAWSRKPNQVVFTPGAEDACLSLATSLSTRYSPPLVEGAEQRIKLARLSVALAARLFSTDDGHTLLVRPAHVEFVAEFMDTIYTKPSMAFDLYSAAKKQETTLEDEAAIQAKLDTLPADFRGLLSDAPAFTAFDLQDYAGLNREAAADLASFFVRKRCVRKGKYGYYKLPAFIKFLRSYKRGTQGEVPF